MENEESMSAGELMRYFESVFAKSNDTSGVDDVSMNRHFRHNAFETYLNDAEFVLRFYVTPAVTLVGLLGNMLIALPVCRLAASRAACPFFVYALCIVIFNSLLLLLPGLQWLTTVVSGGGNFMRLLRASSPTACHVTLMLELLLESVDHWLVVCLVAHCLAVAVRPRRAMWLSRTDVRDAILLVVAALAPVSLHYFWTYHLQVVDEYGNEEYDQGSVAALAAIAGEQQIGVTEKDRPRLRRQCALRSRDLDGNPITYGQYVAQLSWLASSVLPLCAALPLLILLVRYRLQLRRSQANVAAMNDGCRPTVDDVNTTASAVVNQSHSKDKLNDRRTTVGRSISISVGIGAFYSPSRDQHFYQIIDKEGFEDMIDRLSLAMGVAFVVMETCCSSAHCVDLLHISGYVVDSLIIVVLPFVIATARLLRTVYQALSAFLLLACSRRCRREVIDMTTGMRRCVRTTWIHWCRSEEDHGDEQLAFMHVN